MLIKDLRRKLVRIAKTQLYSGIGVRVVDLDIGPNAGIAIELSARVIERDDPLIAGEPSRADSPEASIWCSSSAIVQPHAGFGTSLPLGGAVVNVGFSAEAFIGVAILANYPFERDAALEAAKRAVRDLPLTSDRARAMRTGTEVTLSGRGNLIARTGVGAGIALATIGVENVGLLGGASVSLGTTLSISLIIERLQGTRVRVSVHQISARSAAFELSAHAGFEGEDGSLLDDLAAETLAGTPFSDRASPLAIAAERQLERWLSIDLRAVHERARGERQLASYELDLDDKEAAQAYERLLMLDTRFADDLTARGGTIAKLIELAEKTKARRTEVEARFGKISLLREASKRDQRKGSLTVPGSDPIDYERIVLTTDHHDIITALFRGARSWIRQLIVISPPGRAIEYHYHVTYRITDDKRTSADEVKTLVDLARALGLISGSEALLDAKFYESFDYSNRVIDVFFTHAALEKLAKTASLDLEKHGHKVAGELSKLAAIFKDPTLVQGTGWDADLEPHTLVLALAAIAGAEETIIVEVSITDILTGRKLAFAEAGAMRNFDPAVRAVLAQALVKPVRAVDGAAIDPGRPTELTCHLRFVYFDPAARAERPLPDGVEVRVRDHDPWSDDDVLATGMISGGDGRITLVVPADDELEPDLYFEVLNAGNLWDSRHRDPLVRSSVLAASFGAGLFGTPGAPVTWSLTYDCFLRFDGLAAGTKIQAVDSRPLLPDILLAEGTIGADGAVHLALNIEHARRPNIQFRYSRNNKWRQVALPVLETASARIGSINEPVVFQILEG